MNAGQEARSELAPVHDGDEAQLTSGADVPAYTVQAGLATAHGASPDFQGTGEEE